MKKIYLIIMLFVFYINVTAQQLPQITQYVLNNYIVNPAAAGMDGNYIARSTHRYQWEGITDAPRTYTLSVCGPSKNKKFGYGGYIYTDNVGPTRRTGFQFSYTYHLLLNSKLKLAFAAGLGLQQFKIDGDKIILRDAGDATLNNSVRTNLLPDATFGAMLYDGNFYFGLSLHNLINNKLSLYENNKNSNLEIQPTAIGGYKLKISDDFKLEPSFLVKYVSPAPIKIDLTLRAFIKNMIWIGGTYRTNDAIAALFGYEHKNGLSIGYSYDFTTSNIKNYSTGSHELMIGFKFGAVTM
jgi:type IX secretion system PorP/SprF family membrane protein